MLSLIKPEIKITWKLWIFGLIKIPLILFCRPKVIKVNSKSIEVKIKLRYRTKNHLESMYFGVLAVGADVTGGFFAMKYIQQSNSNLSLIFKDFSADFLKRAEGDVHFTCNEGIEIQELVKKAEQTGERHNLPLHIFASVPSLSNDIVAKFILNLSIKKKS